METKVVPSQLCHCYKLAPNLRQVDKDEVMASSGLEPLSALTYSFLFSDEDMRWTGFADGEPVCMFGASRTLSEGVGGVWMLGSDGLFKIQKTFLREAERYVAVMHTRYSRLCNFVDARNTKTLRWLRFLGFTEGATFPEFGVAGIPFIFIESNHV